MTSEQPPAYVDHAAAPPLPPRSAAEHEPGHAVQTEQSLYPPPPPRPGSFRRGSDLSSPIHYTRDPHNLVGYLVPFPKPQLKGIPAEAIPPRFLIYTPPPPPLKAPKEGEKEGKVHKLQRKWQEEVRDAKTSTAKTASWKGVKSRVTKGINVAMGYTKTSNLEFINRLGGESDPHATDPHTDDGHAEGEETHRTVGLESLVLVYPSSISSTPEQLREEFINTMLRSKTKAQRDTILATGLLPVSLCVDVLATLVWPFGGLVEIDSVWLAASFRGAKISRSVTKRLASSSTSGKHDEDKLKLEFTPSQRLEVLETYLNAKCHDADPKAFPSLVTAPTESTVLEALGWSPAQTGGETRNWEDEAWQASEVKDDLASVMTKGAREWNKWVKAYEKDPAKAAKKC